VAHGPRRKPLDFAGNPNQIALGSVLRLEEGQSTPRGIGYVLPGAKFNSNNYFAGSAALAECALY